NGASERWWLAFGVLAGFGLLNKQSMAFFGVAFVAALLLTPLRRSLLRPWIWLGGAIALTIFLPNLLWEISHHFPHLEMLANIRASGRDVTLSPFDFLLQQLLVLHPATSPLWLAGIGWTLFDRRGRVYRIVGLTFILIIVEMLIMHGRVYYPAPAYPMVLAAGGVAVEQWLSRAGRMRVLLPAWGGVMVLTGVALAPLSLPMLPPDGYVRYAKLLGFGQPRIENHRLGPLPQLFADRFGWKEMAEEVAKVYRRLPRADQRKATIFAQNYGQAGAINLYGPALGLPKAISAHDSYFYWGPGNASRDVVIVLDDDRETLQRLFRSVEYGGHVEHPYSMPYQHFDIWVCRGLKMPWSELWPKIRKWD
ncbi:MAG: glycosyltransferase family 39 protein, partial [Thermoanaerobaculia bacterium]